MKRLSRLCQGFGIACLGVFLIGCHDAPIGDDFADKYYSPKGAVVSATNVQTGFFDVLNPDQSQIAFDLVSKGESVSSTDINVSFEGGNEVLYGSSPVPGSLTVTLPQLLDVLGLTIDDVAVGDQVTFTFDVSTSSGVFRSSRSLTIPFSCFSDLGGTHDFVSTNLQAITGSCPSDPVTGTVTWTDLGGGTYSTSDLGFGQYGTTCWNDSPATSANARFMDVCNEIISGGQDQYGLTYVWTITDVSGAELSMSWFNDYGDSGNVVITREGGEDWPPLFTN